MTLPVFPTFPGLGWSVMKGPRFATRVQKAVSGRQLRLVDQPYPIWDFTLTFNFLRDENDGRGPGGLGLGYNELRTLMGFFWAAQGQAGSFLFEDPTDNAVTSPAGTMNAGDGTTTQFQLYRGFFTGAGQGTEPVIGAPTVTHAYINGVDPGGWSVSPLGLLTWGAAPASGTALTWTGTYSFQCRFSDDALGFENFMFQLWQLKQLKFESVLL